MKSTRPKKTQPRRNGIPKRTLSHALRAARRSSAYAFVASLGVWLPRAHAATLISLDSSSLPTGPLNTWPNTGTVSGDFVSAGDTVPQVVTVDGVQCVALTNAVGTAGGVGTQYIGPATPLSLSGRAPRTVEAWIFDPETTNEIEKAVFSFGRRNNPNNFALEHGSSTEVGAVNVSTANQPSSSNGGNGGGNIGWNGSTNIVLGRWTHIAATYDGLNLRVFSDGVLRNSEISILNTAVSSSDGSTNVFFRVGRQTINNAAATASGVGVAPFYVGKITVTDTNLTDAQILADFNAQKGAFNLGSTSNDGIPDWWRLRYFGHPDAQAADQSRATDDPDSDGATNLEEYQWSSDPHNADTDGDGIKDGDEIHRVNPITKASEPTDPTKADTDGDGLSDAVETGTGVYVSANDTGTNPTKADTDGDGYSDGLELDQGTDPLNGSSHPAPLINLDATTLAIGPLNTWTNSGTLTGDFNALSSTNPPSVELIDGINAVHFRTIGGGGTNGQSYLGPQVPDAVAGVNPRTITAWVRDDVAQDELTVFDWGSRGGANPTGNNWSFGMGQNDAYGAVAQWGNPDIGWNDYEVRGRWTFIAATYDGTATRVYADGQLADFEAIAINTLAFAQVSGTDATLTTNRLHFRMAVQNSPTGDIDATGKGDYMIANAKVYGIALDSGSIKAQFDAQKSTFGLNDSDGDGMPDWYEKRCGLNPNDPSDATTDKDADGLSNLLEFQLGTRADLADTDGDGIADGAEVQRTGGFYHHGLPAATNPLNPDTDGDGLSDKAETDTGKFVSLTDTGTDPLSPDSDGDGFSDLTEILQGSDPNDPNSVPSPLPLVNLIATNALPAGTLQVWTNTGRLGGTFVADNGGAGAANVVGAVADDIQGVHCLTFTGGTYVGPAATQLTGNPAFSCEAWVYNPTFQDEEAIITWGGRGGPAASMSAFTYGNDGTWGAMTHWAADLSWNGAEVAGRWTYLAYTYDPRSTLQSCYLNGTLVNSNFVNQISGVGPLNITDLTSGGTPFPFRVGCEMLADGTAAGSGFSGTMSIGEIRVYSRTLSQSDITAGWNAGQGAYGFLDSDGDGIPDWWTTVYFGHPTGQASDKSLATDDPDGDGLSNLGEYQHGTNPLIPDTDGDGLTDGQEVNTYNTNPLNPDTDRDGVPDATEIALGTDPLNPDSDGDGFSDSVEVAYGSNPLLASSTPDLSVPKPLVDLDATSLPLGPLTAWTNNNALGWTFIPSTNSVAVQSVAGARGVTFDGTDWATGPNMPDYLGGNSARTVEAWIYDPVLQDQPAVFAWGRRGGNPDGSNAVLTHGSDPAFGAVQLWGSYDVPWGTNSAQIASNVHIGAWTFISYTYDPATTNVNLYVDGQVANTQTEPGPLATFVNDPLDPLNIQNPPVGRTLPFRIAAQNNTDGTPSAPFGEMTIAKIRAYNTALSAQQIANQYNAEKAQFPGALVIKDVKVNVANGIITFDWTPSSGQTYSVQANPDLSNPNGWTNIATNQTSGPFTNSISGPKTFYRLRVE